LGAGAIIRLGNNVRGLTTAASLWFIAAVGLAIGAGMFIAAAVAEALALATLWLLSLVESRLFPSERNKLLVLSYKENNPSTKEALQVLSSFGIRVLSMDVNQGAGKDRGTKLKLLAGIPTAVDIAKLAKALKQSGSVGRIEIKEKY
jgi:putative Mg2+ transporter-C (MgtC) family protein